MSEHATVIDRGLNVRSGPGIAYDIIDKLNYGDRVTILQRKAHWAEMKPDNGSKRGWVHSASLRMDTVPAPEAAKVEPPHNTPSPSPSPGVAPIEYAEPSSKHDHGPIVFLCGLGLLIFLLWLFGAF